MPHKGHDCSLDLGSDSMLPKSPRWSLCRRLRLLCLISEHHPIAYRHYYSYAGVIAERQRHLNEGDSCLIHPFSLFSLSWKTFMSLVNLGHMIVSTMRLGYVIDPKVMGSHALDHILFVLNIACLIDIILIFQLGFVESPGSIVLDRSAIAWRYIRFWCPVDMLSCLPISYFFLSQRIDQLYYLYIALLLAVLRTARLPETMKNLKIILKLIGASYICYSCIHTAVLFVLSAHWCSCLIYFSTVSNYYLYGFLPKDYNEFLNLSSDKLTDYSIGQRYKNALFISLSSFFGTGYSLFVRYEPDEVIIHSIIIMYSTLFMVYVLVFLIKTYMSKYNTLVRYHELMDQVKEYMRHRQFPAQLKKRVIVFYYYTFHGTYYKEDFILESLSEQLRNEITLHSCHKLLNKIALFEGLPASVVGSVLGCLHPEVFLPNDLVVRAGDWGDCMYFIASGTVAVYSLKGVEVCHLEDGAYFGEVALLMKDNKRVASVVAVEITQVYRLDDVDFRHFIVSNPVLFDRFDKLASQRMHETVLLDEAFRRERERLNELMQFGSVLDLKEFAMQK